MEVRSAMLLYYEAMAGFCLELGWRFGSGVEAALALVLGEGHASYFSERLAGPHAGDVAGKIRTILENLLYNHG